MTTSQYEKAQEIQKNINAPDEVWQVIKNATHTSAISRQLVAVKVNPINGEYEMMNFAVLPEAIADKLCETINTERNKLCNQFEKL